MKLIPLLGFNNDRFDNLAVAYFLGHPVGYNVAQRRAPVQ